MKNFDTEYHSKKIVSATGANGLFFQPKLTIYNPKDKYDKKDAIADKIMGMKDPLIHAKPIEIAAIQRKCGDCDEKENTQQRKESNIRDLFFKPAVHLSEHTNGPSDKEKKEDAKPVTPCPDSVSIGALKEFNHGNLSATDQEKMGYVPRCNISNGSRPRSGPFRALYERITKNGFKHLPRSSL